MTGLTITFSMQYYENIIHTHRPWMSKTLTQPRPPKGPGSEHARMMCIESAASIGKLLHLYELQYSFHRMNIHGVGITCSAASLLIFASITNFTAISPQDTALHLSACFRALDSFGSSWETAKKARDFLVILQKKWGPRGRSGTMPRKRTRAESQASLSRNSDRRPTSVSLGQQQHQKQGSEDIGGTMSLDPGFNIDMFLHNSSFMMR